MGGFRCVRESQWSLTEREHAQVLGSRPRPACVHDGSSPSTPSLRRQAMPVKLTLTSPDIAPGERIGDRFAGQEGAETPRLEVIGVPPEAVELAIVCHDPDAPMEEGFTHWTLYGLAAQDGPIDASAGRPGPNDDGGVGYVGPFPPAGDGD